MTAWTPMLAVVVPLMAAALASMPIGGPAHGPKIARAIAAIGGTATLLVVAALVRALLLDGDAIAFSIGERGLLSVLQLRADGLSAAMALTVALIMPAIAIYAGAAQDRPSRRFWALLMAIWAGLNAVFLSDDLFGIFVAVEFLTLCAVSMICLGGRPELIRAGLRYLLFASLGSALYLLGIALLHGVHGTLSLTMLAAQLVAGEEPELARAFVVAVALMTVGMLAKAGLFPLHLWLPSVHANAPAAVSAIHSALVVKASFFIVLRLWLDLMRELPTALPSQLLALLGALAILIGSVIALRQARLKMLVAWSTVAQIGYLFILFPLLVARPESASETVAAPTDIANVAITGSMLQAISHAFAKAAMFLAAGLISESLGHDRLAEMRGVGRAMPTVVIAFVIGGASLMGLPPSGGFWAKWLLLTASLLSGQWWWGLIMFAGGLLAGGYIYRVVAMAFDAPAAPAGANCVAASTTRQAVVMTLALVSLLLGLMAAAPPDLVMVGRSFGGGVATP